MDNLFISVRGPHIRPPRELPSDPVAVEQWHASASYELSFGMPGDVAVRLIEISNSLLEHARELAQREEQLEVRRKILFDRVRGRQNCTDANIT